MTSNSTSSSSFYVILPSNTNVDGNRTNSFRVRLPRKLQFGMEWCVGLAVLVYPHTWPSLGTNSEQFVRVVWRTGRSVRIPLPQSTFKNPLELREGLKRVLGDGDEELAKRTRTVQNTLLHLQTEAKRLATQELEALQQSRINKNAEAPVTNVPLPPTIGPAIVTPATPFRPAGMAATAEQQQQQ